VRLPRASSRGTEEQAWQYGEGPSTAVFRSRGKPVSGQVEEGCTPRC